MPDTLTPRPHGKPARPDTGGEVVRFGGFRIVREIGRGGMGVVYEAVQEALGRRVALKVLSREALPEPADLERFRREARAAGRLHHTNIVPVFGLEEHDGRPGIVMQFIEGRRLDELIAERRLLEGAALPAPLDAPTEPQATSADGALPSESETSGVTSRARSRREHERRAAALALQVAEALAHAHARGVLHRDVKPSNVLVDGSGRAWVTDFGLAKSSEDHDLTAEGDLVGTLRYLAPERFHGVSDARSDVYAFGLILYELLALRPALDERDRAKLVQQIVHGKTVDIRSRVKDLSRDLETIVGRCIARDPEQRYPDAAAVAEDLRRFLEGRAILGRRVPPHEAFLRWCRRNPVVAGLAGAVALLVAVLAVGSTVSAVRLRRALDRTEAAEREGLLRLHEALVAQARAIRQTPARGHRIEALAAIERAVALHRELDLGPAGQRLLRDEAIAALGLTDLEPVPSPRIAAGGAHLTRDGSHVTRASAEDELLLIDAADGRATWSRAFSPSRVPFVDAAVDGSMLLVISTSEGSTLLELVDVSEPVPVLAMDLSESASAALSEDGSRFALAGQREGLRIFSREGRLLHQAPVLDADGLGLRFSPDGRRLALVGKGAGFVEVWDLESGARSWRTEPAGWSETARTGSVLEWSRDGTTLAGSRGVSVITLDASSGRILSKFEGHLDKVVVLRLDSSGRLLASSSYDGTTRLWDLATGSELVVLTGHALLGFGAGNRLMTMDRSTDESATWDVFASERELIPASGSPLGFTSDGRHVALAGTRGVELWDTTTRRRVDSLESPAVAWDERRDEAIALQGNELARFRLESSGSKPGLTRVSGSQLGDGDHERVFTAAGRSIVSSGSGELLLVGADGRVSKLNGRHPGLWSADVSLDGRWAVTGPWNGRDVMAWDLESDAPSRVVAATPGLRADVRITADGRWVLLGTPGERACLDLRTWTTVARVQGSPWSSLPAQIDVSDRGDVALATDDYASVLLIEVPSLQPLARFPVSAGNLVSGVALGPGGATIAMGRSRAGVELWRLDRVRQRLRELGLDWSSPAHP